MTCSDGSTCSVCESNYVVDTNIVNSDNTCICIVNMYMYQGSCVNTCPLNLYGNTSSRDCETCPVECTKCNSLIDCTECASGYAPTPVGGKCICN